MGEKSFIFNEEITRRLNSKAILTGDQIAEAIQLIRHAVDESPIVSVDDFMICIKQLNRREFLNSSLSGLSVELLAGAFYHAIGLIATRKVPTDNNAVYDIVTTRATSPEIFSAIVKTLRIRLSQEEAGGQ